MSVHLSPPGTSASHCECCEHKVVGRGRSRLICSTVSSSLKLHATAAQPPVRDPSQVWNSPVPTQQERDKDTREATAEPREIHATLGAGVNENESREKESISAPSIGPLTLHQLTSYTTTAEEGFTYKHLCMHTEHVRGEPLTAVAKMMIQ